MGSAHRIKTDLGLAQYSRPNSTDASTLEFKDESMLVFEITTAAAETRTLAVPIKAGLLVTVVLISDGGDLTLTVTNFEQAGTDVLVFDDAGDSVTFISIQTASGTFAWRILQNDGVTGPVGQETQSMVNLSLSGTLAVTGASTLTGAVTCVATLTAVGFAPTSATAAAIATTRTLDAADSGGIFTVAKTGVYTITLPTPAQGLNFKFLVLDTGANIVTILADGAFCFGLMQEAGTAPVAMTGTTLLLTSGQSVSDWVQYEGIDSTHWLVTGATVSAGDITIS